MTIKNESKNYYYYNEGGDKSQKKILVLQFQGWKF